MQNVIYSYNDISLINKLFMIITMMGHQTLITRCKIDCGYIFNTLKEKCDLCLAMWSLWMWITFGY